MQVNRMSLLNTLESVYPGLSKREMVEQSSCFVFKDGRVTTFNDEIACSHETELQFEGAVQAEPLLAILRKLGEEVINVEIESGEFRYRGKRRRGGVRMEAEILLPVDSVDIPKEEQWKHLPPEFSTGVSFVEKCCGKDEQSFSVTCVHIYPKWVEAYDNLQVARYNMRTGVKEAILVRQNSIKHIHALGMTEICETGAWLHFRNPAGLVLSCRRSTRNELDPGSLLDVSKLLDFSGTPTALPKGLADAADKAEVFSTENSDGNVVRVQLKTGKLKISGRGNSGWYEELKDVKYKGDPLDFLIDPKLLAEITSQHNDCEITEDRLKVDGKRFVYVTCLGKGSSKDAD